jgi:hypothetical protein
MRRQLLSLSCILLILVGHQLASAQTVDWAGTWAGPVTTDVGTGAMQIILTRDGNLWKSSLRLRLDGPEIAPTARDLLVDGNQISFVVDLDRNVVKFSGTFERQALTGSMEVFTGERRSAPALFC